MKHPFDELAKELARGLSRREALRRLGGGLAGTLLAALGLDRAWGQGNSDAAHFCQTIPPGLIRDHCIADAAQGFGLYYLCDGDPARLCGSPSHTFSCCAAANACCGGACRDLQGDSDNCGQCGNVCPDVQLCGGGTCVCAFEGSLCVGPAGAVCCPMGFVCDAGGMCQEQPCPSGTTDCFDPVGGGKVCCTSDQTCCAGACRDLTVDLLNCGACGHGCSELDPDMHVEFYACCLGHCCDRSVPACCNGQCTNFDTDPNNCGLCGNVCAQGEECSLGECHAPCGAGTTFCPGYGCVDTQTDNYNCGACGSICPASNVCVGGRCLIG